MSEQLCKNNRGKFGCQNVVTEENDNCGYCEHCYWPGIVVATQKYEELVAGGMSRVQAAEHSGLNEGEAQHRLKTVPIDNVEQDIDLDPEMHHGEEEEDVLGEDEEDEGAG